MRSVWSKLVFSALVALPVTVTALVLLTLFIFAPIAFAFTGHWVLALDRSMQ